jgi:pimeloyl-ACP methyl ester carboxylesterase
MLHHRQVEAGGISIHVVEGGSSSKPAVLFLHGWPQNWAAFESIMIGLSTEAYVVAIDLPGIGDSQNPPRSNDKKTLAGYVSRLIESMGLSAVTFVGHDIGRQIVYAYLHSYPEELQRAVIMNVPVPSVDPWDEVKRNPYIWHFAFHAVRDLPEMLVRGKEARYFAFFYDALSGRPGGVNEAARERYVKAYSRPEALHTGFE